MGLAISAISAGTLLTGCDKTPAKAESQAITIYAAASLSDAINDINQLYEQQYHTKVKTSFAGSSTLAKQIEHNAPADVFISADTAWVDYLKTKGKVNAADTKNLLGNQLVLINAKSHPISQPIAMDKSFNITKAFSGKLCTGNTSSVPVGKYAKQALTDLGWWNSIKPRLVETEDVRAALNFVDSGECQLGIVYTTDAKLGKNVNIVGIFPESTHKPIVYASARLNQKPETQQYYQFLQSPQATAIYQKYGFQVLP